MQYDNGLTKCKKSLAKISRLVVTKGRIQDCLITKGWIQDCLITKGTCHFYLSRLILTYSAKQANKCKTNITS